MLCLTCFLYFFSIYLHLKTKLFYLKDGSEDEGDSSEVEEEEDTEEGEEDSEEDEEEMCLPGMDGKEEVCIIIYLKMGKYKHFPSTCNLHTFLRNKKENIM